MMVPRRRLGIVPSIPGVLSPVVSAQGSESCPAIAPPAPQSTPYGSSGKHAPKRPIPISLLMLEGKLVLDELSMKAGYERPQRTEVTAGRGTLQVSLRAHSAFVGQGYLQSVLTSDQPKSRTLEPAPGLGAAVSRLPGRTNPEVRKGGQPFRGGLGAAPEARPPRPPSEDCGGRDGLR